ncbi:MAG TPA: polyphosphate kinase 1 [Gemmatimonadaceae bacterium]|nr:polyphosphate kinase 1 [Gemmatimonadaceae bacterium]
MTYDQSLFINRELSWLEFNARVLHEAFDDRNQLLERLKFLAIYSTNLDEFYMVRVAGLRRQVATGARLTPPDGMTPQEQLDAIQERVSRLVRDARHCLHDLLLPALEEQGIKLVGMTDLTSAEWQAVDEFFETQVFPVLTPLAVEPGQSFSYISNLSLALAVELYDPERGVEHIARVRVPKTLPRWVPAGRDLTFIPLEQVIGANLSALFPGMEVRSYYSFRVTRYSDLELPNFEEDDDLLALIEEQVFQRRFAEVVRIEVQEGIPASLRKLLLEELQEDRPPEMPPLTDDDVVETGPLLDLGDLHALAVLEIPELRDPPLVQHTPVELRDPSRSIFDVISERDVLVHHPFDAFSTTVDRFVTSAAADPDVLAIKMTLYRTSGDTVIVRALTDAANRGKQVTVLIELQARFEEANNIAWARTLESAGVHVSYGLAGLKTHSKTTLIVRREAGGIRRYGHIGSGNYNSKTARTYTDIGLFTSSPSVGADLTDLFNALTGFSRQSLFRKLIVAPANMRRRFIELIAREAAAAMEGRSARIIAKMNSLVDAELIDALYSASQAGVEIDLLVRGICCLRPGVSGVSDRIRVRSLVGRFLEHSRVFFFANGGNEEYYFGSSDWMPRNLDRRVEAVAPVDDSDLRARLCALLKLCLADNTLAWDLAPDGAYTQRHPEGDREIATHDLLVGDPWGLSAFTEPEGKPEIPEAASEDGEAASTTRLQSALPSSSS